ncbi:MAG: hypothetical protein AAFZ15_06325 [Bacteroidota bacterium]
MGVTAAMMTIVALAGTGIYFGLKTIENLNPRRGKIQKDLKLLKIELQPLINNLVPWSEEEMSQLSLNVDGFKKSKGVTSTAKGVFTSIYHEPLIAWVYKKYVSSKENALVYAKTSHLEFIYRIKKNFIEVVVNNELVGQIDSKGALYPVKGKKALAFIEKKNDGIGIPVIVFDQEAGRMNDPTKPKGPNPRAFQVISQLDEEREKLFLCLCILEIVRAKV